MENFEQLLNSVRSGSGLPPGLSPLETIPSLLRGAFRAPAGFRFVASDLSQIELRVLAWLTNCGPMLEAFALDKDLYIEFASAWFGVSYEEIKHRIEIDHDPVAKLWRQISKPAVLSCGYGSGGGQWKTEIHKCTRCKAKGCDECEDGYTRDEVKTGLWGYAESMGVNLTQDQAHEAVQIYRQTYSEVVNFWYRVEDPIRGLLKNPQHRTAFFDKLVFHLVPDKLLRILLPSGRCLHYLKPEADDYGNLSYDTEIPPTKIRGQRRLYGSLLTENLVQAIARDVMAVGMVRAVDAGFKIVGHTHDELLTISPINSPLDLTRLNGLMTDEISWCRDLPLKAEGWEGDVYRK